MFGNRNGGRGGFSFPNNRPVCQFYLEGRCRYGDSCKNEHPSGQGPASQNRFAALGNNNNSNNRGRQNAPSGASTNTTQSASFGLTAENIRIDLTDEKPEWPLSSYGPGKNAPKELLDSNFEQSPEEMRLLHYMAMASGNAQQTPQQEAALMQNVDTEFKRILADLDGAVKFVVDGKDQHPNRLDMANNSSNNQPGPTQQTSGFASQQSSSFGQPSAFGKNAATTSAFGQPSSFAKPSPFGQPANTQTTSAFGQASALGQTSAFGKPSALGQGNAFGAPSALGQNSAFGAPSALGQNSAFGQPSALGSKPAFGQPAFGQQSQPAQTSAFGQPSQPAQTSAFGQRNQPAQSSAFGQPSQPAQTSAFGQPSQPGQTSAFGKPSQPASGFGSPSPFGQQAAKQASPFASAAAPQQQQSAFGQPSAFGAQSNNTSPFASAGQQKPAFGSPSPFGAAAGSNASPFASAAQKQPSPFASNTTPQQSSPFANASPNQSNTSFGQPTQPAQPSPFATNNQAADMNGDQASASHLSRDSIGRLSTYKGRPVTFNQTKGTYTFRNPSNNKNEQIWFPDSAPGPTTDVQASEEDYQGDLGKMLEKIYEYVAKEGVFENGIMPEIPPKREWVAFDI